MRGQTPVPFSASAGGGGFVAKRGGCVSSHHSPRGVAEQLEMVTGKC